MLGIEKTASIGEIRKAYKKLTSLLHPAKNSAPGSGEAFDSKIILKFLFLNINYNITCNNILFMFISVL